MGKVSCTRRLKMVIFSKYFVKNNLAIRQNIFYVTLLSRHTVTIGHTYKPIILGY